MPAVSLSTILNTQAEKKNPLDYQHAGIKVIVPIHCEFEITIRSQKALNNNVMQCHPNYT